MFYVVFTVDLRLSGKYTLGPVLCFGYIYSTVLVKFAKWPVALKHVRNHLHPSTLIGNTAKAES